MPENEGPRDRAGGIHRLPRRVGDHVPAAEREQPCADRQHECPGPDLPTRGRGRPAAGGREPPPHRDERGDGDDLDGGERRLHPPAVNDAGVVDGREHEDDAGREAALPALLEGDEDGGVPREHHRDGRQDPGVHGPEHRPAPEEAGGGAERLGEEHVDPAGARERRGQLGADQRPAHGEGSGGEPGERDGRGRGEEPRDLGGLDEDRRADDDAHHHGGGLRQTEGAPERGRRHAGGAYTSVSGGLRAWREAKMYHSDHLAGAS